MSSLAKGTAGSCELLMGNEAIARGALEAGVQFAAGYPGTPSSEIMENLARVAKERGIYVEWSVNEKVATEAAAAASLSGLRGISAMKNAGLSVALDFLLHLSYSGLGRHGGGLVVAVCDDPEGHSSGDETDSRWLAKWADAPLLEPDSPQEAKDMVKWAFQLSEEFGGFCLLRSYTRLSHASGPVTLGEMPRPQKKAHFDTSQTISPYLAKLHHANLEDRLAKIHELFESSPFNWYRGPEKPELLIVCSGSGRPYSLEAIERLNLIESVGVLKLGTLWPFPKKLVGKHLAQTNQVLVVEEVDPFIENHVKETAFESASVPKSLKIYGKDSGHLPQVGETTPDSVLKALSAIFNLKYQTREPGYEPKAEAAANQMLIPRGLTYCPGCPHRASFWSLRKATRQDGRGGFLTGDIGCYTMDVFPDGSQETKALHAMGSGVGLASGFGKLGQFGSKQPVIAVCGDSTFYHAAIPALVNAVYNKSNMIMVLLDNRATAMTGFQPHPGTGFTATGDSAPVVDAERLCQSLGCKVVVSDPFDIEGTTNKIRQLMKEEDGVRVLILRRACELIRMREEKRYPYRVWVDTEKCRADKCGFCTRVFKCPGLTWDKETGMAQIIEAVCCGCGVCVDICPYEAILREETA